MYSESLGVHASQLSFNLVSVEVTEGRYLPDNNMRANPIYNNGVFFKTVRDQFFDSTAVDIAIMEEVLKEIMEVLPITTAEGILQSALVAAADKFSITNQISGREDNFSESRLEKLLAKEVPATLEWERDTKGQSCALPLFIKKMIPFLKTKEWLQIRLDRMKASETDRYIAAIQIQCRPALKAA